MSPAEPSESRRKGRNETKVCGLEAGTLALFKLDTLSAVTGQGVASDLQYAQSKGKELLPDEIEDAEEEILSRAQLEAFPEEYMALLAGKEIPKKSSLSKLCPWLDDQSVLRCGG